MLNDIKKYERRYNKAVKELNKGNKYYKGDTKLEILRAEGLLQNARNYGRDYKVIKEK